MSRRPNRSSASRRAQYARADARRVQHLLKGFEEILLHRGCQLSRLGEALQQALKGTQAKGGTNTPHEGGFQDFQYAALPGDGEKGKKRRHEVHGDVSSALVQQVPSVQQATMAQQGTGVAAVGSTPAAASTQSAGVVTTPAAPPAKQELAVQQETTPRDAGVMSPPVFPHAEIRQKVETELLPEQVEEEEVGAENPASSGADPTATAQEIDQLMASSIVLKTYRFVRSTKLVGPRDPIFRTPAEIQEEHTVRHRESPCRLCTLCWSELRQEAASLMGQLQVPPEEVRKCICAKGVDFGELRELIAELRELVVTDEVCGET
jgi:hypothetical protein